MYVVFDLSIFVHANWHIMRKFMSEITDDQLAFKVAQQITSIHSKKFPNHKIVLACDYIGNFRKKLDTAYKASRSNKNIDLEVIYQHMHQRFTCIRHEGLEADDIAYLFSQANENVVLVSDDNDYLLMLDKDIRLYKNKSDQHITLTSEQLAFERCLKVVKGCKGDEVPDISIGKMGPKTLEKLYDHSLSLTANLDNLVKLNKLQPWQHNYELAVYDTATYIKHLGMESYQQILNKVQWK